MGTDWMALWRRTRARPLLPALALTVLAAGVGAGVTVFGIAWAVLFRALPYPDVGRLVVVQASFPGMTLAGMGLSGPEASELPTLTRAFAHTGFGYLSGGLVDRGGAPVRADVARVSAGYLAALGAAPARGRVFTEADDVPAGACTVVLGWRFSRTYFDATSDPIGRTIRVDGSPCEVIGIWPDRVAFTGRPVDVWLPLRYDVSAPTANRSNHAFTVLARIGPGWSVETARDDLSRAVEEWMDATGEFHSPSTRFHPLSFVSLDESIRGPVRSTGLVLLAAVVTMLLVTVANASGLFVADADRRRQELAVRAVLGADRSRLWRLHLIETGTFCGLAGCAGGLVAFLGSALAAAVAPPELARLDVSLSPGQTALVAAAVAVLAAAVCSLLQASRLPWRQLASALGSDGRTGTATAGRQRLRRALVALEVALAVALVAAAALMTESVGRLTRVDLGFQPEPVLRAHVNLPADRYDTRARIDAFYAEVAAVLHTRPDVLAVGALTGLVPERRANNSSFVVEGAAVDSHMGTPPVQFLQYLTPDAFPALGITLRQGRLFTAGDVATSEPVVILNERAAGAFFAGRNAIGGRMRPMAPGAPWLTVVGVVADVRQDGLARVPGTEVFMPLAQADRALGAGFTRDLHVMVRGGPGDPARLAPALRDAVRHVDPGAAVSAVEPLDAVVRRAMATERFLAGLLGLFALVALVVAAAGVYGVIAHVVLSRTREIGIRRALGASSPSLVRLVLAHLVPPAAAGLLTGTLLGAGALRLLAPFSFDVDVASPGRLLVVGTTLAVVVMLASARPLALALRVEPSVALRQP